MPGNSGKQFLEMIRLLRKRIILQDITATTVALDERFLILGRIALLFLLLIAVVFILTFIQVVLLEWVGQSVMHRIRQELFRHIVDLDLGFLNKQTDIRSNQLR